MHGLHELENVWKAIIFAIWFHSELEISVLFKSLSYEFNQCCIFLCPSFLQLNIHIENQWTYRWTPVGMLPIHLIHEIQQFFQSTLLSLNGKKINLISLKPGSEEQIKKVSDNLAQAYAITVNNKNYITPKDFFFFK